MPNIPAPDITPGTTAATDTVIAVKSGGDESLALLPYGADLAARDVTIAAASAAAAASMQSATYDAAGVTEQVLGTTATQVVTGKTLVDFSNDVHANATHKLVRNESGGVISAGMAVYISGYSVGQGIPLVSLADATSPLGVTEPVVGIAFEEMANNASGGVISFGAVSNIDTSAWAVGDVLFMSTTPGVLTNVKPTGSAAVQRVAQVLRSHATLGRISVVGASIINDVPNFSAADKFWYGDTGGTEVEGDITAAGRALLDDVDAAAQRATLGAAPLASPTFTGTTNVASLTATGAVAPGTTTTAGRPAAASIAAGGMLYDSDLAKIILTNGTSWTNVDGTSL